MQLKPLAAAVLTASVVLVAGGCGDAATDASTSVATPMPATAPTAPPTTTTTPAPATSATTTTTTTITTPTPATSTTTTTQPPETTTTALPGGLGVTITTEIAFKQTADSVWESAVFRAEGAAVDAGVICGEGDLELFGYDSALGTWRREVKYVCGDGSGWFLLELDLTGVHRNDGYGEEGTWFVRTGTGEYAALAGYGADVTRQPETAFYVSSQEGLVAAG